MSMWNPLSQSPELTCRDFGWPMSEPVLAVCRDGQRLVAKLEQIDEDSEPRWYTDCSEHWNLGDRVVGWLPLPPPPDEAEFTRLLAAR